MSFQERGYSDLGYTSLDTQNGFLYSYFVGGYRYFIFFLKRVISILLETHFKSETHDGSPVGQAKDALKPTLTGLES
jgi:hypothetical protein